MTVNSQEKRFQNPNAALAAAREMSQALTVRRADLFHVLEETVSVAQRHGNFTEHSGVPHRRENGAVPKDQARRHVGKEAIEGARHS